MTAQMSKSLTRDIKWKFHKRTQQGVFVQLLSYLYKFIMVHATNIYAYPNIHAPSSCSPHICLKTTISPNVIFQIFLHCSRSMTSHHVTNHVTSMSHASSLSKIKEKKKKKEIKIKQKKCKIQNSSEFMLIAANMSES